MLEISYGEWLIDAQNKCKVSGVEITAPLIFLEYVLDKNRTYILSHKEEIISEKALHIADKLLTRRLNHEPLAYILNNREFYGRDFYVDKNVLIPRPESEMLIDEAKNFLANSAINPIQICDIGTGSGCLITTLSLEIANSSCTAFDISEDAINIAKKNAKNYNAKIDFQIFDISKYKEYNNTEFQCIISNPPYIPEHEYNELDIDVKNYEPEIALTSGISGLELIEKVLQFAQHSLASNGILLIEHGYNQHNDVQKLAKSIFNIEDWKELSSLKDYADNWRIFKAIKK